MKNEPKISRVNLRWLDDCKMSVYEGMYFTVYKFIEAYFGLNII